jgi:HSP20 family protein
MSTLVKSKKSQFPSLRSMMDDFWDTDRFFAKPFFNGESLPAVNIRDAKNHYEVEVAAPGFKKDDFKITTEKGLLIISAETSIEKEEEKNDYTRKEFSYSSFTRSFSLPDDVEEDGINAKYRDGLLSIDLKKSGKSATNKKEVKVD